MKITSASRRMFRYHTISKSSKNKKINFSEASSHILAFNILTIEIDFYFFLLKHKHFLPLQLYILISSTSVASLKFSTTVAKWSKSKDIIITKPKKNSSIFTGEMRSSKTRLLLQDNGEWFSSHTCARQGSPPYKSKIHHHFPLLSSFMDLLRYSLFNSKYFCQI